MEQAIEARDSFARTIYEHLFSWIVQRMNDKIGRLKENGFSSTHGEEKHSFGEQMNKENADGSLLPSSFGIPCGFIAE